MHNPLTRQFTIKLRKLHDFAGVVEEAFVTRAEALDAKLAEKGDHFPETERFELFEYYAEDYFDLSEELPTILRYSVLTAADTAFEVYLNNTCETYAEVHDKTVRLNDLKDRGIERASQYLKKVAGVPFPDQHPAWAGVRRLHELRNSIVHADGVVPIDKAHLRQWARSIAGLSISDHGRISLGREFTAAALAAYEAFALPFDTSCADLQLWRSVFPFEDA